MKKTKNFTTLFAVGIAVISTALAVYVMSAKNTGPKTFDDLSSTAASEKLARGMINYFNLDESQYETLFQLYKTYEDIRVPYDEKLRIEREGGKEVTSKEMRDFIHGISEAKEKLEAGVRAILTEEQYKEWRKKERRSQVTYK